MYFKLSLSLKNSITQASTATERKRLEKIFNMERQKDARLILIIRNDQQAILRYKTPTASSTAIQASLDMGDFIESVDAGKGCEP